MREDEGRAGGKFIARGQDKWRPINEVNQIPSAGENFAAIALGREMK